MEVAGPLMNPRTDPSVTTTRRNGRTASHRAAVSQVLPRKGGGRASSLTAGLRQIGGSAFGARQAPFVTPMVASLAAPSPCMAWTRFPRLSTPTSRPS